MENLRLDGARFMGSGPPGPPGFGLPRPRCLCERTPHVHVAPLFSKVLLCWAPPGILTTSCHRGETEAGTRGCVTGGQGAGVPGSSPSALRCTRLCLAPSQSSLRWPSAQGSPPPRTCELLRDGGHSTAVRPGPAGPSAAHTAGARLALIGFLLGTASLSTGKGSDRILIPGAPPGTLRGPPSLTREILL